MRLRYAFSMSICTRTAYLQIIYKTGIASYFSLSSQPKQFDESDTNSKKKTLKNPARCKNNVQVCYITIHKTWWDIHEISSAWYMGNFKWRIREFETWKRPITFGGIMLWLVNFSTSKRNARYPSGFSSKKYFLSSWKSTHLSLSYSSKSCPNHKTSGDVPIWLLTVLSWGQQVGQTFCPKKKKERRRFIHPGISLFQGYRYSILFPVKWALHFIFVLLSPTISTLKMQYWNFRRRQDSKYQANSPRLPFSDD